MFIGNQHLIKDFRRITKNERLAHGYIFFGEHQLGKFSFALSLANFLEKGNFDISEKILSETLIIKENSIDGVRKIKNFLWQKPLISKKRITIIDNADSLTPEAQNAILKIAEEPPNHALIILIVNNLDNLLSPIISRFHKIYFGHCNKKEICEFLIKKEKINKEKALKIAEESYGRPGMAIDLINNKNFLDIRIEVKNFLKSSGFLKSQIIKKIVKEQKETPEILDYFFKCLLIELRKDSINNYKKIETLLDRLFLIKSYNVNKRIQLETI
ncbi:AAA family ATPase [Patescibacteria group bacterium]|nr:AAA family ATPase [Patescibacteria group bacterium]